MKTLIWYGATAVVLGVAVTISGQSEIANDSNSSSSYIQTSKLVGRKIKSSDGKEIGIVKDVVIDRINGVSYSTVVSDNYDFFSYANFIAVGRLNFRFQQQFQLHSNQQASRQEN